MLMRMHSPLPARSVVRRAKSRSSSSIHVASPNSGKRNLGFNLGLPSFVEMDVAGTLLLIRAQSRDVAPMGALVEEGKEIVHEGEFSLGAGVPAKSERRHEIAQLLTIENHA